VTETGTNPKMKGIYHLMAKKIFRIIRFPHSQLLGFRWVHECLVKPDKILALPSSLEAYSAGKRLIAINKRTQRNALFMLSRVLTRKQNIAEIKPLTEHSSNKTFNYLKG